MAAGSGQDELARLAYESQMLKAQEAGLREQLSALQSTSVQLGSAAAALTSLAGSAGGFVQLGAGVLIPAAFPGGTVLVGVGAGVFVEKDPVAALALVEKRLAEVAETGKRMSDAHGRLSERIGSLEAKARGIMSSRAPPQAPGGHAHEHGIDYE